MTAPALASPTALLLIEIADICERFRFELDSAYRHHQRNPADPDTLPAIIDCVQEMQAEVAKWEKRARYQEGEPQ